MRNFLAFLVLVVFVVLCPLSLYAFNLPRTLFDPGLYKRTLSESKFYEKIGPLVADLIANDLAERSESEGAEGELPPLDEEEIAELEEVVAQLIDPVWLKQEIEANIDAFSAWLEGEEDLPDITFDLRPVKEELPEVLPKITLILFEAQWEALPLCAAGELPALGDEGPSCRPPGMTFGEFIAPPWEKIPVCGEGGQPPLCRPADLEIEPFIALWWELLPVCAEGRDPFLLLGQIPTCKPADMTLEEAIALLENPLAPPEAIEEIVAEVPDEFTFRDIVVGESRGTEALQKLEKATQDLGEFRDSVRRWRVAGVALLGLSAASLTLLVVLAATSLRSVLTWAGSGLLIAGFLALVPSLFISGLGGVAGQLATQALSEAGGSPEGAELIRSLLGEIAGAVVSPIRVQSLAMAGLGLISVVGAVIVGARGERPY